MVAATDPGERPRGMAPDSVRWVMPGSSAPSDQPAADQIDTVAPGSDPSNPSDTAPSSGPVRRSRRPPRPSRWDRPPEPHDWRWIVGLIGRVLITIGLLMFAFVGYQLWGTGIQTAQAQNRLEDEFDQLLATSDPVTPPTASSVAPTTSAPTATTIAPPESTTPTSSTVPAAQLAPPPLGDPLARLSIPSIELDKIVISGVRPSDLEDGPGHFPETPLPGQLGNSALAGHRTTHGAPFLRIDEVAVGDDIVVETLAGSFTYVVTGQQIVGPGDYQLVIPTIDPTVATLTLTSCHPRYSTRERIVITALLDPTRSDQVTERSVIPFDPALLPGADEPGLPDEPVETVPASTTPDSTPGTTDARTPATTDAAAPSGPVDPQQAATGAVGQELFENRWFSDPDAFPQVAAWGLVLTLVALAATALSRRVRRNWVGALAGFAPFVVVLYFWFENVNRLLPPNL